MVTRGATGGSVPIRIPSGTTRPIEPALSLALALLASFSQRVVIVGGWFTRLEPRQKSTTPPARHYTVQENAIREENFQRSNNETNHEFTRKLLRRSHRNTWKKN